MDKTARGPWQMCVLKNCNKEQREVYQNGLTLHHYPPTAEAFEMYVKRAHLQACIWRATMSSEPPEEDPLLFGWSMHPTTRSVIPTTLPDGIPIAPSSILKMICCNCNSSDPCSTRRCSCHQSGMNCRVFCKCQITDSLTCGNPHRLS